MIVGKKVAVSIVLLGIFVLANYHVFSTGGRKDSDSFKEAVKATKKAATDFALEQEEKKHGPENQVSLSVHYIHDIALVTNKSENTTAVASEDSVFRKEAYRVCRIRPKPKVGTDRVRIVKLEKGLPLYYQCAGKPYDTFMQVMYKLMEHKHSQNPASPWGKRPLPVPHANKTIVVMGNSHTRQVLSTLLCQYQHLIVSSKILKDVPGTVAQGKNVAMKIELQHGVTFFVLINHPFVYSKRWPLTLSVDLLEMSLKSIDLIVLGAFNELVQSFKSNFLNTTLEYQKAVPRHQVHIEGIDPPYIDDVAAVYHGPIIYLGMFAQYNDEYYNQSLAMMEALKNKNPKSKGRRFKNSVQKHNQHQRTNIRSIYGRNYIQKELGGNECSSDSFQIVATCITDRNSKRYANGHRCVGPDGGQADLIAWDLVETLHELLE